ncbi:hypothetical protein V8B97DRAFT_2024097 [Scleroderma yunnanense]
MKQLWLNGVIKSCWNTWALSDPSDLITPKVLHHFHWMFCDHDVKWCINATGAAKLDFCLSIIETLLKQVTTVVAGSIPCKFLTAIHTLLNFHYLAQVPLFTTQSLEKSWSADITEHAHIEEIKVPVHAGNNQNYYNQIACHLDQLDKCLHFDLATYIQQNMDQHGNDNEDFSDPAKDKEHKPGGEDCLSKYSTSTHQIPNYFSISASLLLSMMPSVLKPYHTFTTPTTDALATFFANRDTCFQGPQHPITRLQIWHKVCVQKFSYHNRTLLIHPQSDWPRDGLVGHSVTQLHMIFHLAHSDLFLMYVQHFNIVPQSNPTNVNPATGMHLLRLTVFSVSVSNPKTPQKGQLLCIPPHLRHKTNWLHAAMDTIIENDTHETHWKLSRDNSDMLLNFLFPDEVLYVAEKSDHYTMEQVLNNCITKGLYNGAPKLDTKAPTAYESSLASFFNKVIVAINKACATVTIR